MKEIDRTYWHGQIELAWKKKPIVWLAGVRRTGKTTLARGFKGATYVNCDLPSNQEALSQIETFLKILKTDVLILDEIHQLPEASQILKIIADEHPKKRVLATGSSTLIASKKFKDSLTGRKTQIHFVPVLVDELESFDVSLKTRIHHGGLPQMLMASNFDHEFFGEWLDSYYARDIQELFHVEKRQAFLKLLEILFCLNGKLIDVTELAQMIGLSRPTVIKYLDIFQLTKAIMILRPFSQQPLKEIISQPKIYAFDTGFVCYAKKIDQLRTEDCGDLLENLTLETLIACGLNCEIQYWRTKSKLEIDFILQKNKTEVWSIECKWNSKNFKLGTLKKFREQYPKGVNLVVCHDLQEVVVKKQEKLEVHYVPIHRLLNWIKMNWT